MAESKTAPTPWNKDPKLIAFFWIVSFITGFVVYYLLRRDFMASLVLAFAIATVLAVLNWMGVGLPKQGAPVKTGTTAS